MGYAINVAISVPLAIMLYLLTEKFVVSLSYDNKFNDKVQKNFVIGFVVGLSFIALGMTVFSQNSNMDNQTLQLAMYMAGVFLVLNSVLFSWDDLDETTKIIILGISATGLIIYSYKNR